MNAQVLDRTLLAYRIGDPNGTYPIFDATGSVLAPGRWNTQKCPIIYSSHNFATALLEKLVHGSGQLPPNQHYIEITVPRGTTYEVLPQANVHGWDSYPPKVSKKFGDDWCRQRRSLILIVPSVIARLESNILINPSHPDFKTLNVSLHQPVFWDQRLFSSRSAVPATM